MSTLEEQIAALGASPDDEAAAEAVRTRAREEGAFDAYARAFSARGAALAAEGETEAAVGARVEAALVFEEDLGDLAEAASEYEAVLELEPDHRRALFSLGLLFHDLKRWDDLIALYRRRIEATHHAGEQTTLHLYAAEVLADRLEDKDAAFTEVMAAARLSPKNIRIIGRLEKLGAETGRHEEVAVTIGDLILNQEDPKVRAALSLRLAELHLGPLDDETRALTYLKSALADDGGNPEILGEMEDVFRERDRFDALAELLEVTAEDRRVGPHRVRLERELARIYEHQLDDAPRALQALTRAVRHAPDDRELLDEVMRLGLTLGDLGAVAECYAWVIGQTDNALLQTYMRLKLGHIYGNVLERVEDAIAVYGAILSNEPTHAEARRRLLRIHQRREDYPEIAALLEQEVSTLDGAPESFEPLERLLELYTDRIDDPGRAVEASRRLLELDPEHPRATEVMADARPPKTDLDEVGNSAVMHEPDEAATEFDGTGYGPESETQFTDHDASPAPRVLTNPAVADMQVDDDPLAAVPGEDVDEESDATIALLDEQVLHTETVRSRSVPAPAPAEEASEPAYTVIEPEAAPADRRPVPAPTPPPPRLEDPDLEEDVFATGDDAPDAFDDEHAGVAPSDRPRAPDSELDEPAPEDEPDVLSVASVFESEPPAPAAPPVQEPSADLIAGLELDEDPEGNDAEEAPPAIAVSEVSEAAALVEVEALAAVDDEVDGPEDASPEDDAPLARPPDLAPTPFLQVVAEASEALRQKEAEGVPTHGLASRHEELRAQLETAEPERAVELLDEIVAITEAQDDLSAAFDAQAELTNLSPDEERVEDLMRLGRASGRLGDLLAAASAAVEVLGPEADQRFTDELAELETELGAHDAAAERLGRAYASRDGDGPSFGRWLAALERAERPEQMAAAMIERARGEPDLREAQLFLQRAVAIYETRLEDPSRAADALLAFLETAPGQEALQLQAEDLLEAAERWSDLAGHLEARAERLEGAERAAVRHRLAGLYRDRLDEPERAEQTIRQGLDERALDPDLLEALWTLLESSARWDELVDVGLRRVEVVKSPRTRGGLRRRLAQVAEVELSDPGLAEEILEAALTDDARDLEALEGLERLRRARDDFDGVYDVLELQAAATEGAAKTRALTALAQIRAENKGDLDGAAELLRQAVALEPEHDEALGYLAEIEERRGDFVGAADVLRANLEARPEETRAPLHARLGALLRAHFGDLDGARGQFEAVLELAPDHVEAVLALLSIAEAEGRAVDAHALATRAASLTTDDRGRAELWVKAAGIAQDELGDDRRAIEALQQALAADPEDLATQARLGELFLARGEPKAAVPHLMAAAEGLSDPERAAELFLEAGGAAQRSEDPEAAKAAFSAVLERRPAERDALEALGALLDVDEDWTRAYDISANLILHHEASLSPKERAQVYLRMARARWGQQSPEAAHRLAKQAHHLDPSLAAPLSIMADALEAEGEAFEAAECLKRLAPLLDLPEAKKDVLLRAGRLLQEEAEDPARAAAMLTEAQEVAPDDEEVGQRLAVCRAAVNDAPGAADALCLLAKHRTDRARADRLVQAARVLLGADRERARAHALLTEALDVVATHDGARRDLEVVLEYDDDLEGLAAHWVQWGDALLAEAGPEDEASATAARGHFEAAMRLHRDRLRDPERALEVLRRLIEADGPERWQEEYARLLDAMLETDPASADALAWEAIRAWSSLVEATPGRIEGLQRLYELRTQVGEVHLALIAAELLDALGAPLPNGGIPEVEPTPIERLQSAEIPPDPSEGSELGALFEELGHAPVRALQDLLPAPRPKRRELVGVAGLGIHVSRPLETAARLLGVAVPPVYVREEAEIDISPALGPDGAALVVSLARLQDKSEEELRFLFGRALSLLRPRALALGTLPLEALRDALVGFAQVPDPEARFADPKLAKKRGRALDKAVPADARADLKVQVGTWLASANRRSLGAERQCILRSAERAGLVVSGSLRTSLHTLSGLSGGRMEREWRMPLIRFAATRAYAEIMRRRG